MSEVLTVPTAFADISEMAQGLVDRVDEQQIILYGPSAFEEGSELGFALQLLDGTTALEGRGVVAASVDGGEDRDPSTRYDIIIQALKFDGVAEVVFERMVMARLSAFGDEQADVAPSSPPPASGEAAPEEAFASAPDEAAYEPAPDEAAYESAPDEAAYESASPDEAAYESAPAEAAYQAAPAEEPAEEPVEPTPDEPMGSDFGGFDDESTVVAGIEHAHMIAASAAQDLPADGPAYEPEVAVASEATAEPEPEAATDAPDSEDAPAEAYADEEEAMPSADRSVSERPPQSTHPLRSFAPPPPEHDSLRPAAADLPIRPGAPPPEPPAPPPGFAIDNSLADGLVRPHEVWSPVAPPPPEPRPSSGLFQYAPGAIPIPQRPPRPDLDPSFRVDRAPAPIREGEVPRHSEMPAARPSRPRRIDFDDALMADAVDLDPVSADD